MIPQESAADMPRADDLDEPPLPSGRWTLRQIALHVVLLAAVLVVYHFTRLDLWVQEFFYDRASGSWLVPEDDWWMHKIFYAAPDVGLGLFGLTCIGILVASIWRPALRRHRRFAWLMVLSMAVVTISIGRLKVITRCYTPEACVLFGGRKQYVRAFETYPPEHGDRGHPRGWPAGHAAGGFSLMALAFACRRRRTQCLGLALGLTLGWAEGVFQMARGLHYLSDNFVTMEVGWIEILALQWFVRPGDGTPLA